MHSELSLAVCTHHHLSFFPIPNTNFQASITLPLQFKGHLAVSTNNIFEHVSMYFTM